MKLTDLIEVIQSNGYKVTEQRKAILQVLDFNQKTLLSVESLFYKAQEICQKTNMSTVYRNLEILETLNLIYKIVTDNGVTLYKLICFDEHHHHIICKGCGKTEAIEFCPLNIFIKISKDKNYILTDHKLELYGYCCDCQSSKEE
ncbi:MAG: transcriptional repressor [Clostridia bacterium]|nr:transcriptional repressor [Clostridia bacterium]